MENCIIITENTVGVVKPKTFGGEAGQVSRSHFSDFAETVKAKEKERTILNSWSKYRDRIVKEYHKKKNADRYKRLQIN